MADRQGFWREPSGTPTSEAIALEAWVGETYAALVQVAGDYHAVIRTSDLAERVQVSSGIRTSRPDTAWLAKVLLPVAHLCRRNNEPSLTALVVDARSGWVGDAYDDVMRVAEQLPILDPLKREAHAAAARLECYRWAGSAPADGGVVAAVSQRTGTRAPRTSRVAAAAGTPRKPRPDTAAKQATPAAKPRIAASDRPVNVCPRCFMAIPATGVCDNCD